MKKIVIAIFACTMIFVGSDSTAQRVGGGKSFGKQSTNVLKRQSTPAVKTPAATKPTTSQPATSPTASPTGSSLGPMLGGLAAGLGLAWLANSLGLGEAFGNILMILLMAGVVIIAVGWFISRRQRKDTDTVYGK